MVLQKMMPLLMVRIRKEEKVTTVLVMVFKKLLKIRNGYVSLWVLMTVEKMRLIGKYRSKVLPKNNKVHSREE